MTFADLAAGDQVFLDANIFIYHCSIDPVYGTACTDLLDRIGLAQISGFTSTHVLLEVAHRLMCLEAARLLGKPQGPMAHFLKKHLSEIQRLSGFRKAIEDLCASNISILSVSPAMVPTTVAVSQQAGLLTNDALVVAVMQGSGLSKIASNDPDFERVLGITRYAPL